MCSALPKSIDVKTLTKNVLSNVLLHTNDIAGLYVAINLDCYNRINFYLNGANEKWAFILNISNSIGLTKIILLKMLIS